MPLQLDGTTEGDAGDRSAMENAVRPLDDGSAGASGAVLVLGENTPSGHPQSSFHCSFPSRPKRRDLLWEGPSGGLVSGRCGHWSEVSRGGRKQEHGG